MQRTIWEFQIAIPREQNRKRCNHFEAQWFRRRRRMHDDLPDQRANDPDGFKIAFPATRQRLVYFIDFGSVALCGVGKHLDHVSRWISLNSLGQPFAFGSKFVEARAADRNLQVTVFHHFHRSRKFWLCLRLVLKTNPRLQ
jgi:hypothetical protein